MHTTKTYRSTRVLKVSDLQISAQRITPAIRSPIVTDKISNPVIYMPGCLEKSMFRKKIVVIKNKTENEETPSIMISDEMLQNYVRRAQSGTSQSRQRLTFTAIRLPKTFSANSTCNFKSQRAKAESAIKSRILRRRISEKGYLQENRKRVFDYNDIYKIAETRIKIK